MKIVRFRRDRWTRPGDYGAAEPKRRFWPEDDPVSVRGVLRETGGFLRSFRPFILVAILVSAWVGTDPALVEPPGFLSTGPERVSQSFTRCGRGRGHACVVDGDTFKLGDRKVRVIGIDAPEVQARCPSEAALAEAATAKLQALLNEGPFEMVGRVDDMKDRYGRDLRVIRRRLADGRTQSIAAEMRDAGLARRYLGGWRGGWC